MVPLLEPSFRTQVGADVRTREGWSGRDRRGGGGRGGRMEGGGEESRRVGGGGEVRWRRGRGELRRNRGDGGVGEALITPLLKPYKTFLSVLFKNFFIEHVT